MAKRGYRFGASIVALLTVAVLAGAPAAYGKAKVIKTLGPLDGTKDNPQNIAINHKTNTIYAANIGGEDGAGFAPDTVSVIDGKTDTIVANVVVDDHPFGLAVDEQKNLVYVANVGGKAPTIQGGMAVGGGGTIMVIDGNTNTVLEEFDIPPVPGAHLPGQTSPTETGLPGGLAFDPETGYLWVANDGEVGGEDCCQVPGALSVYDTNTKQWIRGGGDGIPAGITPIQPVIDERANRVYVASIHTQLVTVVNSHTLKTVAQIEVLPEPYDIAVDPRRHRLYIGHFDSRAASETEPLKPYKTVLEVLDTKTLKLLDPIYAGRFTRQLDVNPLTGRVYVNNLASGSVTIVSPRGKVIQTLATGSGPRGLAVNPLTDKVYVGNANESAGALTGGPGLDGLPDTISVIRDKVRRHKRR